MRNDVYIDWIVEEVSVEEAMNRANVVGLQERSKELQRAIDDGFISPVVLSPYEEWVRFIDFYDDSSSIWIYNSPEETWENLMGSTGLVILKNGSVISHYELMGN